MNRTYLYYIFLFTVVSYVAAQSFPVFIVFETATQPPAYMDWLIPWASYILSYIALIASGYVALLIRPRLRYAMAGGLVAAIIGAFLSQLFLGMLNGTPLVQGRLLWDMSGLTMYTFAFMTLQTAAEGLFFGLLGGILARYAYRKKPAKKSR